MPPKFQRYPRIAFLAAGGTISGISAAGRAYCPGRINGQKLLAALPPAACRVNLSVETIYTGGSQDIGETFWMRLARRVNQLLAGDCTGVVISHGTDTLEETAFLLEQVVASCKPVVLTGAMRPILEQKSDGKKNLADAISVAADPAAHGRNVMVVFNGGIYASRQVIKTHTTKVAAMSSPNGPLLGRVAGGRVCFLRSAGVLQRPLHILPARTPWPRVEIIYAHGGMSAVQAQAAISSGVRGIVLAGVGNGNAPAPVLALLAKAVQKGIAVVRASRVAGGLVERNIEVDDDKHGFVAALDLSPAKARLLLQLLLAEGITAPAAIQAQFLAPA